MWLTFEELSNRFPKRLHHFISLPAIFEGSNFSTSSSALGIICLFDSRCPGGCEWHLIVVLIYTWGFLHFWKVPCLFLCLDSHRPFRSYITPASKVVCVWRKLPSRGPSRDWRCPHLLMALQSLAYGPYRLNFGFNGTKGT